ncbi:helix-turn-helix domain-containing protein [Phenylobacterium sp. LjRoot225]|uniref:helix-turn-helix domain-containing protein n=1 Tax=Phenylobacterium sp. LjRoot225 TaxID=3342285 RepID=UPI003ECF8F61
MLEILEYFDRDHPSATVMDMSRALAYPQSSTSELLRSLTRLGYLHYNRYRRTYSPKARVALLGSWVDPALFRGGTVLGAVDKVAELVGETVLLSTAANYLLQHLHVVPGASEQAVLEHAGRDESLLHSPQGRLILSSYRDMHIRSALHRLNAEEPDPERRVRISERLQELVELRKQGWLIEPEARDDGAGVVTILLPPRRGVERLALSVLATRETIETRGEEILAIMLQERDHILPQAPSPPPPTVMRATISSDFEGLAEVVGSSQDNHRPRALVA